MILCFEITGIASNRNKEIIIEIRISNAVFKPAVDLICEPDYFNSKVLGWFEYREQLAQEHKRTYTYAATYEEFMKKIKGSNDVEHLKQMRYPLLVQSLVSNVQRSIFLLYNVQI